MPDANPWDADLYDGRHAFVWRYGAALIDLLDPRQGERILDVGAGTGHLTAEIAARGASVIGLDAAESMVEQARRNHPQIEFVLGDAASFAFGAPFDAVFSNATLHWVRDASGAASSISKALRAGGRFVAELGGQGNIGAIVEAVRASRLALGLGSVEALNPWYFPSVGEYASLLEDHGLEVTYASLFDRPTPLEAGASGLQDWLRMFATGLVADLDANAAAAVFAETERRLRPTRYQGGVWSIDYRRLRVVATKC